MHYTEHVYTICMIKRKIYVSVHIREKHQFENYYFQTFFRLFYLLHPISLNLNKFETDTPTEEKLT